MIGLTVEAGRLMGDLKMGAPSKAYVNQLDNPARLKANHRAGTELCA
jgi:hypothetical protein